MHHLKHVCLRTLFLGLLAAFLLNAATSGASESSEQEPNRFGFTGPEIFPIDNAIGQLKAADLDGDGLIDLVVVNNARSKINLLYNQTGHTNQAFSVARTL